MTTENKQRDFATTATRATEHKSNKSSTFSRTEENISNSISSTHDKSPDLSFGEKVSIPSNLNTISSTHDKSPDLSFGEKVFLLCLNKCHTQRRTIQLQPNPSIASPTITFESNQSISSLNTTRTNQLQVNKNCKLLQWCDS